MTEYSNSLVGYTEQQREEAMKAYEIIRPFLEDDLKLAHISKEHGVPTRTLWRWVKNYKDNGLAGLIRKQRSDQGQRRKVTDDLQLLIEGLALQKPPLSIAAIHRKVRRIAKDQNWPIPSYATVYQVIQELSPALLTLAREGKKAYKDKFDLVIRREAERPNEIWQADHTPLDIWLLNDKGDPARPWLTVILDEFSRAVAGYFLSFQNPNILNTALSLRQAIWHKNDPAWEIYGIPDVFYTDNGSDFTSNHMEQVAADIGMRLVFSTPGEPRGRGKIERFFESVNQLFLREQPGYSPDGKFPEKFPTMRLADFEPKLRAFLIEEYNRRKHGTTNMPPQELWSRSGFIPRMPETLEQLDLLLLTVAKARKVHPDGIQFNGFRYVDTNLAAYVGESIIIRYDPRDLAEIRVYYEGKFLCRAICYELAGQNVSLKEIIRARQKRHQELSKEVKKRSEIVDLYLGVHQKEVNITTSLEIPKKEPEKKTSTLKRYINDD